MAELYVTDPAKTDIRETMDIDCVTQLSSYGKLAELEELLRKRDFIMTPLQVLPSVDGFIKMKSLI